MYVNVQNPMSQKTAFHLLQVCLYFDFEVMLGCSFLPCPKHYKEPCCLPDQYVFSNMLTAETIFMFSCSPMVKKINWVHLLGETVNYAESTKQLVLEAVFGASHLFTNSCPLDLNGPVALWGDHFCSQIHRYTTTQHRQ